MYEVFGFSEVYAHMRAYMYVRMLTIFSFLSGLRLFRGLVYAHTYAHR